MFHDIIKYIGANLLFWIVLFSSSVFIYSNVFQGIYSSVFFLFYLYISHYISHQKMFYPLGLCHNYHHWYETRNTLNIVMEIVYEFIGILIPSYIYILCGGNQKDPFVIYNFIMFFTYLTTHFINSSYPSLQSHRNHHLNIHTNYTPDCIDLLLNTKSDEPENMNHIVPNILILTIIFYIISKKDLSFISFVDIYTIFFFIYIYYTGYLFLYHIYENEEPKKKKSFIDFIKNMIGYSHVI